MNIVTSKGNTMKILAVIIAITFNGDIYVAGSGDDCRAAWEHVELPKDWERIECVNLEITP